MEFFGRNEETIQSEKDALDKKANEWGNNAPMVFPQSGTTMVRVLPPYSDAGVFYHHVTKHRVQVGRNVDVFACPADAEGLPCAICVIGQELTESKDEAKMKFARDLRPRNHYLYNVLVHSAPADRDGEVPEFGKVYVLETGIMVHRQIIALDQDPATGWADITNPQSGVNIVITRTGHKLDTKYNVTPHGAGRTDVFADCVAQGIDPNTLELIRLNEVYATPDSERVEKVASTINVGGGFGPTPTPRPALPTVSPAAAAAIPSAPATVVPGPVAAPAAPVMPVAQPAASTPTPPQNQPVTTPEQFASAEADAKAAMVSTTQPTVPQPPVVPAPPPMDDDIPF
jgi:hypothetical protein